MARRGSGPPPGLPTRQQVLDFIRDSPGKVGKREIARAFGIQGSDRIALKALLRDLVDEGHVEKRERRSVIAPGKLPEFLVAEVVALDDDGEPWGRPVAWQGEEPAPRILFVSEAARAAPGIGDRALVRLRPGPAGAFFGHVVRRLPKLQDRIVGIYRRVGGGARITPVNRRVGGEFAAAHGGPRPEDGELVVAEPLPGRRMGLPEARVVEAIGLPSQPRAASLIAIHAYAIPTVFPEAALAEAEGAKPVTKLGERTDLRSLPLVTIDDEDARDFDDAVFAAPDPERGEGCFRAVVAIADVAHYVRPDSALDRAARERGNSAYFPDRVVPMLPEALSNELCSLKPAEDRPCMAVELFVDAEGRVTRHRFLRGLMRSAARLTYRRAQAMGEGAEDKQGLPVDDLYGVFRVLRHARRERGALDIDLPERRVYLDDEGNVASIVPRARFDSHRLVEELMIAANVAAAETLEAKRRPAMYRIHDQPGPAKVEALREFLDGFGISLRKGLRLEAKDFNRILLATADKPYAPIVHEAVLRTQAQAEYSPDNIGHFGLALRRYAHFTSPIRRYADLLVHRALISGLKLGPDGLTEEQAADFAAAGQHITNTERRADRAERDATDRYVAAFIADKVGATFAARITGVGRFGVFVRLDDTGAEGLIPASRLPGGPFRPDEGGLLLQGDGVAFRIGEGVQVVLREVDPVTASLRFDLLAGGSAARGVPRRPGRRPHTPPRRRR